METAQKILNVIRNERIRHKIKIFISHQLLNKLQIVILKSNLEFSHAYNNVVVLIDLSLLSRLGIKFNLGQHGCPDNILQEYSSIAAPTLHITIETVLEFLECPLPFLLTHVHLASTLFDDTDHTWIFNSRTELLR